MAGHFGVRGRLTAAALCVVSALAVAPGSAAAATRWAEPGGNAPPPDCFESNPCSLYDAAGAVFVQNGDTVLLKRGTYTLGSGDLQIDRTITVRPAPGAGRPLITSNGNGAFSLTAAARLQDLSVSTIDAGGDFTAIGTSAPAVLERMIVHSSGDTSFTVTVAGGTLVRNSVITSAEKTAINTGAPGATIQNTTALAREELGVGILAYSSYGSPNTTTVVNSIAQGDSGDIVANDGLAGIQDIDINVSYSNFNNVVEENPPETMVNEGAGNQDTIPLIGFAGLDARQRPGSATIDAGNNSPATGFGLGPLDFELSPRLQGGRVDIGADEATHPDGLLRLIRRRVRPRRGLRFRAQCPPADCELTVTGRLRLPGRDPRTRPDTEVIEQGETERLVLRIGRRKLRRLRGALPRARLVVRAHAEDTLGFETDLVRRFRFIAPRG